VVTTAAENSTTFTDHGLTPGTPYFYKVRAVNLGGNSPNESNEATATTVTVSTLTGPGVIGELFNNTVANNNEPLFGPNQAVLRTIRQDTMIDFDWGTGVPDPGVNGDNFSTRFQGTITATAAGTYTFVSNTDDAGYLFVKGVLVSQDPGGHGQREATILTPITLTAGEVVPFVIYQAEGGGGAGVHLKWIPPGAAAPAVPVPASQYSTDIGIPLAATNFTTTQTRDSIVINWQHNSLNETGVVVDIKRTSDPDSAYRELRRFNLAIENPNSQPGAGSAAALNLAPGTSYTFRVTDFNVRGGTSATFVASTVSNPAGTLTITPAATSGDTNLTQPTNLDWRHWGLSGPTSTNTKGANVAGAVMVEGEAGTLINGSDGDPGWGVISEADASGGQALRAVDNDTDTSTGIDSGWVSYSINFPAAGNYQLFVRRKTDGLGGDNSFWRANGAAMDLDPASFSSTIQTQFDNQVGFDNQYVWSGSDGVSPAGQPGNQGPVIFNVTTPGVHTITFGARELGYRIDKIALIPQASVPATDPARQAMLDGLLPTGVGRIGGPITNFTPIGTGTVVAHSSPGKTFSWSDGHPTSSASATPTGVAVSGAGNGFRFTVPASISPPRQLRVYVGVADGASGTLSATMSDGTATASQAISDTAADGQPSFVMATLNFASGTAGQTMQVDWVSGGGEIILKAAEWVENATPAASTLSAVGTGHGKISVQWNDVGNEASYVLERAPDVGGNPGAFADLVTLPANTVNYLDLVNPGDKFHYRLRATNLAGSTLSAVSTATAPSILPRGLTATYFDNDNWTGASITRLDQGAERPGNDGRGPIAFFWGAGSPDPRIGADTFSSRWDGFVIPDFTQLYTFFADTDDGARIYVDVNEDGTFQGDERIFIDTTGHGVGTQRSSTDPVYGSALYLGGVPLIAGHAYKFRFEQTEGGGDAGARAFWQSPSTPNQIIPLSNTKPEPRGVAAIGGTTITADSTLLNATSVKWTYTGADSTEILGFSVERAPNNNGSPGAFQEIGSGTGTGFVDRNVTAGTRYFYRVRPFTLGGGGSYSNVDDVVITNNVVGNGARAHYFDAPTLAPGNPADPKNPILGPVWPVSSVDPQINFNWGAGAPAGAGPGFGPDGFITRWTFKLKPEFTEAYTFYADTDDGYRLFVDGRLIPEGDHMEIRRGLGLRSPIGPFSLEAGKEYTLVYDMVEEGGDAGARLFWSSPSLPQELVPTAAMTALGTPLDLQGPRIVGLHLDRPLPAGVPYTSKSRLHIQFSEDVKNSFTADTLTFFNNTTGEFFLGDQHLDYIGWDPATNSAIVTFPEANRVSPGVIEDGNWSVTILSTIAVGNAGAPGIHDLFGNFLDGNGDGTNGDFFEGGFYKYKGDTQVDFNGNPLPDKKVDFIDYQVLQKNFGKFQPAPSEGDFDYDGDVDFDDFKALEQQFGTLAPGAPVPVVAPAPTPVPVTTAPKPTPTRPAPPTRKPAPKPVTVAKPAPRSAAVAVRAPQTRFATKRITGVKDVLAS
jgi:hypothetical protein